MAAVTEQVAAPEALSTVPETLQFVPVAAKLTAPVPDPPADVNATGVPDMPAVAVFETVSAAWVAALNVNVLATLVADA